MAGNMTLLAFAAVTAFCWALAVQQLIDISCLRAHSSKLARTLLQQSTAGSNRRMDTLP